VFHVPMSARNPLYNDPWARLAHGIEATFDGMLPFAQGFVAGVGDGALGFAQGVGDLILGLPGSVFQIINGIADLIGALATLNWDAAAQQACPQVYAIYTLVKDWSGLTLYEQGYRAGQIVGQYGAQILFSFGLAQIMSEIRSAFGPNAPAQVASPCFPAGTPIRTPEGFKMIEELQPGDLVLSRYEWEPGGPVESKRVEEMFTRISPLLRLRAGGHEIRVTPEHAFYAEGRGWLAAGFLEVGDRLHTLECVKAPVEEISQTSEVVTVYNFSVADFHTYFVGTPAWKFSVWTHNTRNGPANPGNGTPPPLMQPPGGAIPQTPVAPNPPGMPPRGAQTPVPPNPPGMPPRGPQTPVAPNPPGTPPRGPQPPVASPPGVPPHGPGTERNPPRSAVPPQYRQPSAWSEWNDNYGTIR
jgi:hypothetical protein